MGVTRHLTVPAACLFSHALVACVVAGCSGGDAAPVPPVVIDREVAGTPHGLTDEAALQRQIDVLTASDGAPGALVQLRDPNGRTVTLRSGTATLGSGLPMVGANGHFRVGSITKSFVALAVLQRVAAGDVSLDDSIERYLPLVVRGSGEGASIDGNQITVRQLMQHTSGIADYTDFIATLPTEPVNAEDLVALALAHEPAFAPPGAAWHYSSTGYLILGMLLERLTGQDVANVLAEQVLEPRGLGETYWPAPGEHGIRAPRAQNYLPAPAGSEGEFVDVTELEPSIAGASGQLISTPGDVNRFWQALFERSPLPHWLLDEMTTTHALPEGFGEGAGYGLGLYRLPLSCGGYYFGHTGDHLGVQAASGRDASGIQVTLYITRRQSADTARDVQSAIDTAFCSAH
jgi:D-alanyl-D-alanine carboxypeptidase